MWSRLLVAIGAALAVWLVIPAAHAQLKNILSPPRIERPSYDPNAELESRLRKLGLATQPKHRRGRAMAAPSPGSAIQNRMLRRFDADRDGEVTQREYMSRRLRGPSNSGIRDRRHFTRMRSNFRAADRDRNGRLSKKELGAIRNPRF